jgi:hypothetical protein
MGAIGAVECVCAGLGRSMVERQSHGTRFDYSTKNRSSIDNTETTMISLCVCMHHAHRRRVEREKVEGKRG